MIIHKDLYKEHMTKLFADEYRSMKICRFGIAFDIETDGPSVFENSMIALGWCFFDNLAGTVHHRNRVLIKQLEGHHRDLKTMEEFWNKHKDVWKTLTTNPLSPEEAMTIFAQDISNKELLFNGNLQYTYEDDVAFMAGPASFDWMFLVPYYMQYAPPDVRIKTSKGDRIVPSAIVGSYPHYKADCLSMAITSLSIKYPEITEIATLKYGIVHLPDDDGSGSDEQEYGMRTRSPNSALWKYLCPFITASHYPDDDAVNQAYCYMNTLYLLSGGDRKHMITKEFL